MPGLGWAFDRTAPSTDCGASTSYTCPAVSWRGRSAPRAPCPSASRTPAGTPRSFSPCVRPGGARSVRAEGCDASAVAVARHSAAPCGGTAPSCRQLPRLQSRGRSSARCCAAASPSQGGGAGSAFGDPNTLVGMLMAYAVQLQQQQEQQSGAVGSEVRVEGIGFHPPGCEKPLLEGIDMVLPANSLGLVMGRSGSGKTTLLQVLAGLTEQTSGAVRIVYGGALQAAGAPGAAAVYNGNGSGNYASGYGKASVSGNGTGVGHLNGNGVGAPVEGAPGLTVEERMQKVGLVFQFPERHFLGDDLMQELTFTWPRLTQYWGERQAMSFRMKQVLQAVGLEDIPLHVSPWALSGGQQRRLALAIQLVRQPSLLLLDEPLAGLDWTSRQEVVTILRKLKEQCTLLVVSHDLAEIAPLVDCAWRMRMGGTCEPVPWPPSDLAGLEQ